MNERIWEIILEYLTIYDALVISQCNKYCQELILSHLYSKYTYFHGQFPPNYIKNIYYFAQYCIPPITVYTLHSYFIYSISKNIYIYIYI